MSHGPSRRSLLRAGGVIGGGALLGGAAGAGIANAVTGGKFDIANDSSLLSIGAVTLTDTTVMQSFGFDNANDVAYFAQHHSGGAAGDITITRTNLSGNKTGHVYLKGFGHGTQIGVQPSGGSAYVWTECSSASNGFGTKISRFRFGNFNSGAVLTPATSGVHVYDPSPNMVNKSVSVDVVKDWVAIRALDPGNTSVWHFKRYRLSDFDGADTYSSPSHVITPKWGTFQGHTTYKGYLYIWTGDHETDNATIRRIKWPSQGSTFDIAGLPAAAMSSLSSDLYAKAGKHVGLGLTYREPEGMAIRIPGNGDPKTNAPKLCYGFAVGDKGARKARIYYLT